MPEPEPADNNAQSSGPDEQPAKLSFEQAVERLEVIVTDIEDGKVSLEKSIEMYAQGVELLKQCRAILDRAERKIQLLGRGEDGALAVTGELEDIDDGCEDQPDPGDR